MGFYGTYSTVPTSLGAISFLSNCDPDFFIQAIADSTISLATVNPNAKPTAAKSGT